MDRRRRTRFYPPRLLDRAVRVMPARTACRGAGPPNTSVSFETGDDPEMPALWVRKFPPADASTYADRFVSRDIHGGVIS